MSNGRSLPCSRAPHAPAIGRGFGPGRPQHLLYSPTRGPRSGPHSRRASRAFFWRAPGPSVLPVLVGWAMGAPPWPPSCASAARGRAERCRSVSGAACHGSALERLVAGGRLRSRSARALRPLPPVYEHWQALLGELSDGRPAAAGAGRRPRWALHSPANEQGNTDGPGARQKAREARGQCGPDRGPGRRIQKMLCRPGPNPPANSGALRAREPRSERHLTYSASQTAVRRCNPNKARLSGGLCVPWAVLHQRTRARCCGPIRLRRAGRVRSWLMAAAAARPYPWKAPRPRSAPVCTRR